MFDNFQATSTTNRFNFNINAVSGTLRKSHPKSRMTIQELKDSNLLFDAEQPKKFIKTETRYEKDYAGRDYSIKNEIVKNIVVLQTMLIGEGKAIIEYVFEDEFVEQEAI